MESALKNKLSKELGLIDVFGLSTGAMISAGFFLLPGLASAHTGSSIFLSYFLAAFLIMPAMFSIAELSTAIPRAGGAYFLLDRSLGPMMGTVGGMGTYLALTLKTAFALVGIGAYTTAFFDMPIKTVAIVLTAVFMVINILGAKKTSGLQLFLVLFLVASLILFLVEGFREILHIDTHTLVSEQLSPFATNGLTGIFSTAGFVFVSYLGLTQVASVAEEIKNPERNIPLGMILSLVVTTIIYTGGVFIMVSVLPAQDFIRDLTPVFTASQVVFKWMPAKLGGLMIVGAAIAAFASTGNGGLMAASRYPMAMGRDRVLPFALSQVGRFKTPVYSIILTSCLMVLFILLLSEENIAKMASSFQLIMFIMLNFSVIVMRNSRIETYDPGYHSPLYPWMQIFGMIGSFLLIVYMGWVPILFSVAVVIFAMLWYKYYAKKSVRREGAIFHWFALLGKKQHAGLETELLGILKEKGLRDGDPFDEMVVQAKITQLGDSSVGLKKLVGSIAHDICHDIGTVDAKVLTKKLLKSSIVDPILIAPHVTILHGNLESLVRPALHVITSLTGIEKNADKEEANGNDYIRVLFILVCPGKNPKLKFRLLSRLMDIVDRYNFIEKICSLTNEREIKEYLLHYERYVTLELRHNTPTEIFINQMMKDTRFPKDVLVAMVQRGSEIIIPRGDTMLMEGDIITIIGEPKGIKTIFEAYIHTT